MKIRDYRWLILSSVCIISFLLLSSCKGTTPDCKDPLGCIDISPEKPIIIGVIAATEGESGPAGRESLKSMQQTVRQQVDYFNHPFTLIHHGTDCTQPSSRNAATRLALLTNLPVVIGTSCHGIDPYGESILLAAGIPFIDLAGNGEDARMVVQQVISTIKQVAAPLQDGSLRIPRQAFMDALFEVP